MGGDTEGATAMYYMFNNADAFNQNLNDWCVSQFSQKPSGFNSGADLFNANEEPPWGEPCN